MEAIDPRVTARYLLARGTWQRLRDRPAEAADALSRARRRLRQDGAERYLEVEILHALGLAQLDAADHDAAVTTLEQALALSQELGCAQPTGLADLIAKLTGEAAAANAGATTSSGRPRPHPEGAPNRATRP